MQIFLGLQHLWKQHNWKRVFGSRKCYLRRRIARFWNKANVCVLWECGAVRGGMELSEALQPINSICVRNQECAQVSQQLLSERERERWDIPHSLPCSVDFSFPSLSSRSFLNLSISPCRPSWEHTLCMFSQFCISVCVFLCVCSSENSVGLVWGCMRSCREEMPSNGFRSLVDSVWDISCGGSLKVGSLDCTP